MHAEVTPLYQSHSHTATGRKLGLVHGRRRKSSVVRLSWPCCVNCCDFQAGGPAQRRVLTKKQLGSRNELRVCRHELRAAHVSCKWPRVRRLCTSCLLGLASWTASALESVVLASQIRAHVSETLHFTWGIGKYKLPLPISMLSAGLLELGPCYSNINLTASSLLL